MRDEVRQRLEAKGRADGRQRLRWPGERILGEQLGYEIARYGSGRRRSGGGGCSDDPQVGQAVALLRSAPTPQALLGMARRAAPTGSLIDDPDARTARRR